MLHWLSIKSNYKMRRMSDLHNFLVIRKRMLDLRGVQHGYVSLTERSWEYWLGLPTYAHMYIRPLYEMVCDQEGLIEMIHYFLLELSETESPEKALAIKTVIFPLYNWMAGGRNYDINYFQAYGLE